MSCCMYELILDSSCVGWVIDSKIGCTEGYRPCLVRTGLICKQVTCIGSIKGLVDPITHTVHLRNDSVPNPNGPRYIADP